jgi:bifunctional DNA-binding transcriptional regulator/antitoxin component of YhaV-PrlF toxin-antitoxin module
MSPAAKKIAHTLVTSSGSLTLPEEFLDAIGLEGGGGVVLELVGSEVRVYSTREAVARAQELSRRLFAGKPSVSVNDFLAHRKQDWGRE